MFNEKLLPFSPIAISDKQWVTERLMNSGLMGCIYSFGNNFIWGKLYQLMILDYNGFLISKSEYNGVTSYSFPIGHGDLKAVIQDLIADACHRQVPFMMRGIEEGAAQAIQNLMPSVFDFETVRGDSDYIYSREKLTTLAGKKMQKKRNHIARFKDNPNWSYEPITRSNIEECRQMNADWIKKYADLADSGLQDESQAVNRAFNYYFDLGFEGGLLRRDGRVIAFTMGEPLNKDTYVVHIEKAYHDIQGAYPMMNQQFVTHCCQAYAYINREEDANDEGLRKSKLSYYPEILLTKYQATIKEKAAL